MNPYWFTVIREVCGGGGAGTLETAGAQWKLGRHRWSTVQHRDPRVCADNLARERRCLERERAELEAALAYVDGAAWVRRRGSTVGLCPGG